MLLIVIAHRGEAAEFIRRKHNLPVEFYFNGVYRWNNELLLLSGGDIRLIQRKVAMVCHYFGNKIRSVVNFGIAGALDHNLEVNQIYSIRTVFHETFRNRFNSYDSRSKYDCVTTLHDVLDDSYAQELAGTAHIADRELWGIVSVCSQFDIRFRAYKLISDYAGTQTDRAAVISQKDIYSKHLFDFYTKLKLTKSVLLKT